MISFKQFISESISPQFRRWFGKSCVVDNSGNPLIVYHGTDQKFREFKSGIKTTRAIMFDVREEVTQGFFFSTDEDDASEYGSNVISVYLSIQNPIINPSKASLSSRSSESEKEHNSKLWDDMEYILSSVVYENEVDGRKVIDVNSGISSMDVDDNGEWIVKALEKDLVEWDWLDNPEFVSRMKKLGYDGAKVIEPNDHSGYSWFVIHPTQIKSATDNNGNYDPSDPDITK